MANEILKVPLRSWRVRWLRRLAMAGATYLLCWAVTWVFAPAALNRWWAAHHNPTGHDMRGNADPVEFRTGVPFKVAEFGYWPDSDYIPQSRWWCCVGRPWCPTPFVVTSEVAWVDSPTSGFAGTIWFIWTPFGMVQLYEQTVWAA